MPLAVLYLTNLGGAGFLGPDEPRYASIGREMARSGDWITPRLDGMPWFEKPPLLYWMTALGYRAHLPDEWAARLPVALASLAFLIFFWATIEREFSERVALAATAMLATSAGWVAFSFVAVTDLPMSAALGAAWLIALFDTRPHRGWVAGLLLGLAILAKGFVPVVLIAPVFLIARRKRLAMLVATVLTAAPWYLLCSARNGAAFWNDFFWKQHVERFLQPTLEHVQPWWFFGFVLALGLFPWTPFLALLAMPKLFEDVRVRFLSVYFLFGFVFFTLSRNKLPGYLLPLMPALAIILAYALNKVAGMTGGQESHLNTADSSRGPAWWITVGTLPLAAIPAIGRMLPDALLNGIRRVDFSFPGTFLGPAFGPTAAVAVPFLLASGVVFALAWSFRPQLAMLLAALTAIVGIGYLKNSVLPTLDDRYSVRMFWLSNQPEARGACLEGVRRDWEYGLNYYSGRRMEECGGAKGVRIEGRGGLKLEGR